MQSNTKLQKGGSLLKAKLFHFSFAEECTKLHHCTSKPKYVMTWSGLSFPIKKCIFLTIDHDSFCCGASKFVHHVWVKSTPGCCNLWVGKPSKREWFDISLERKKPFHQYIIYSINILQTWKNELIYFLFISIGSNIFSFRYSSMYYSE